MSGGSWSPWDPEGLHTPGRAGRDGGPDPEPIVRSVRVGFLLAAILLVLLVDAGLRPSGQAMAHDSGLAVTGAVAAVTLALIGLAAWSFRPRRLLLVGKRAAGAADPRERRPRAERARAMGFRGLAMTWATQGMTVGFLPALAGLALQVAHRRGWELLAFAGVSLGAGFLFQREVTDAVRLAVDDPELRARYG